MTRRAAWARWLAALAALGALTLAMVPLRGHLDKAHVALGYLLVVLGASATAGRALGMTVAGAAFVAFNALFLRPYGTLAVADPRDWLVLAAFLVTSVVAAQLLSRATATAAAAVARTAEVDRLATLGAETLSAPTAGDALRAIEAVIRTSLGVDRCEVDVVDVVDAAAARDDLSQWAATTGRWAAELPDGTTHLAPTPDAPVGAVECRALLLPLVARGRGVGVLRVASAAPFRLAPASARLLLALAPYAALGAERVRLEANVERAEAERQVEALRGALLTAVSHDLRTPLTTIKAIAHEILSGASASDAIAARAAAIEREADRLDASVGDLLDLSRIHAGAVRPAVAVNTVDELIGAALARADGVLRGREVRVDVGDAVLAGRFDFSHALRALVNLLENAAKYAPPEAPVEITARRDGDALVVAVLDRGPGVADAERERVFEPFHRAPGAAPDGGGSGLGLSIARGLMAAQRGDVRHRPRDGGGSAFELVLPAADGVVPDA